MKEFQLFPNLCIVSSRLLQSCFEFKVFSFFPIMFKPVQSLDIHATSYLSLESLIIPWPLLHCRDGVLAPSLTRLFDFLQNPFTHESLLLDRKDQKLTRHEKRLAKQGYEMEKKLSTFGFSRPANFYPKGMDGMSLLRYCSLGTLHNYVTLGGGWVGRVRSLHVCQA